MTLEQQLAEVVALEMASAIEPLQRKLAALEASAAQWATKAASDQTTIAELQTRLAAAEARTMTPGPPGPAGRDGIDGVNGKDGRDGKDGPQGPAGKDGAPGPNGKDGLNGADGAQGLAGKDGRDGIDGKDGAQGLAGRDGVGVAAALLSKDGTLVLTLSDGAVCDIGVVRGADGRDGLAGKDGRDGLNGKDGTNGLNGKDGAAGLDGADGKDGLNGKDGQDGINGKDGRDGLGFVSAVIDQDGMLSVSLTDGSTKQLGRVVGEPGRDGLPGVQGPAGLNGKDGADGLNGKDGAAGLNGKDGLGFDDLQVLFDEQKGWRLQFARGDEVKEFPIAVPFDAGIWESGRVYPKGAGVTFRGSWTIAQRETRSRPGDETPDAKAWRLAVRGGRDGKPGRDGRDGVSS